MIKLFTRGRFGELLYSYIVAKKLPVELYTYSKAASLRRKSDMLYLREGYPFKYINEQHYDPEIIQFSQNDIIICADWTKDFFHKFKPDVPVWIVHPSLLPKYRGYGTISEQFLRGVATGGVTVLEDDERIDGGNILFQTEVNIDFNDYPLDYMDKCSKEGANIIEKLYNRGIQETYPQNNDEAVFVQRPRNKYGLIDFNASSLFVYNFIKAFSKPFFGAYFYPLHNSRIIVYRASCEKWQGDYGRGGSVISKGKNGVEIACGQGSVILTEVEYGGAVYTYEDICNLDIFK